MPDLKAIKTRLASLRSVQKITSAMKMVANAKLRQAKIALCNAEPYTATMSQNALRIKDFIGSDTIMPLMWQDLNVQKGPHLSIVISGDRGLCGNYNMLITQHMEKAAAERALHSTKFCFIGRRAAEALNSRLQEDIIGKFENDVRDGYFHTTSIGSYLYEKYMCGAFSTCSVVYAKFKTAMSFEVDEFPLIPFTTGITAYQKCDLKRAYTIEPLESEWLDQMAQHNLVAQLYYAVSSSKACEEGARMVAMDNATRNAGDMIQNLQLIYNRTRQSQITSELIEIVAGATSV